MVCSAHIDVNAVLEPIEVLNHLNDPEDIFSHLEKHLARYGFTSFLVSRLPSQHQRLEPYILLNGWSLDWYYQYTKVNHYESDPVARHCFTTPNPFTWDELPSDLLESREAQLVMDEAVEFGLGQGFTVPIHGFFNSLALVTMAGPWIEMSPCERHLVHLMSIFAHSAAERTVRKIDLPKTIGLLSERERDILRWLTEGLTLIEAKERLGITENTVNEYMRRIRRKLGARTAVQAVVEALLRREIQL